MKYLVSIFLIFIGGCQVSLLPPTIPSQKYVLSVSESRGEMSFSTTDCRIARVYLSEVKVADYMRSAKIKFEMHGTAAIDGEVKALESFEWASSFEGLFKASFERALRRAFINVPGISFLNQSSSAVSDFELGASLVRISLDIRGDEARILGELVLRVFDVTSGVENYVVISSEQPVTAVDFNEIDGEKQIFSAIQLLVSGLFTESYQAIGKRLCAADNQ